LGCPLPLSLLWINHKAKKIWKKYGGKDSKYKKAHKEAATEVPKDEQTAAALRLHCSYGLFFFFLGHYYN